MQQFRKILYVGLNVHEEPIAVAYAPENRGGEIVYPRCRTRPCAT